MFGRFTHSLSALYGHYLIYDFVSGSFLWVMFVHIRQTVREQPDTGYRKSLLPYFTAIPVCCGFVVVLFVVALFIVVLFIVVLFIVVLFIMVLFIMVLFIAALIVVVFGV